MDPLRLTEVCIHKERMYTGGVIDAEKWTVRLPNGRDVQRDVVLHLGAAAIVAIDENNMITLVYQYRTPIQRLTLELPAGKLDSADEEPLVCAKRELLEETGLQAESWQLLTSMHTTPGFSNEKISLFLATRLSKHEMHLDEDEFLDVMQIRLNDAVDKVMRGEICDGKTALGILLAWEMLKC